MTRLRLRVRGDLGFVSANSFLIVIQKSLSILQDIDRRLSEQKNGTLRWYVSGLSEGSLNVDLEARWIRGDPRYARDVPMEFANGLQVVRNQRVIPPVFSTDNMNQIRDIVHLFGTDGIMGIDYSLEDDPNLPTKDVALTAEEKPSIDRLVGVAYKAIGSIEGKVEVVSVKPRAKRFSITHVRTGRSIRCNLTDELEDSVFRAIQERRKVIVSGVISYNANRDPIRVQVKRPIRFLKADVELPSIEEMLGADKEITGDMNTEEYLRSISDD